MRQQLVEMGLHELQDLQTLNMTSRELLRVLVMRHLDREAQIQLQDLLVQAMTDALGATIAVATFTILLFLRE